jgi:ParB-like chromosome segregation protein Spo0J
VFDVPIEQLRPSKFNPSKRTAIKNLGGLMGSIQRHGVPVPLVVTEKQDGKHDVGDGHRRLACIIALGKTSAPCVVWPGVTAQEIWSILNANQMGMTPAQWLEAVVCGLSIEQPEIPQRLQRDIAELTRIVSQETLWRIVDEGKSPTILTTARYIGGKLGMREDAELAQIIDWFMEFDAQAKARAVIIGDYDLEMLREAIVLGRNLNFTLELE